MIPVHLLVLKTIYNSPYKGPFAVLCIKWHLTISWATSCQIIIKYQCACKISSQYSTRFKRYGHFHFFVIWSSAKHRLTMNVILQSLGLDLVNVNVCAKVYQNIRSCGHFSRTVRDLKNWPETDKGDNRAHWKSTISFSFDCLSPGRATCQTWMRTGKISISSLSF